MQLKAKEGCRAYSCRQEAQRLLEEREELKCEEDKLIKTVQDLEMERDNLKEKVRKLEENESKRSSGKPEKH